MSAAAQTAKELMVAQFGTVADTPVMQHTFERIARSVTVEIRAKALDCYRGNGCDTGTGGKETVAHADGFGENVWRQVTKMESILHGLTYPEIGVVLHNRPEMGEPGKDYLTNMREYLCALGHALVGAVKEGNPEASCIVALGGTPGNTLSSAWQACAKEAAAARGIDILAAMDTNSTQEGTFIAVSAVLAQFGDVDGWVYEHADGFRGALRTDEQGVFCDWVAAADPDFRLKPVTD